MARHLVGKRWLSPTAITTVLILLLATIVFAQKIDLTIEFVGPWAFVTTNDGIVAISPTDNHQAAVVKGDQGTTLVSGIYKLTLANPIAGVLPQGATAARFVQAQTTQAQLTPLRLIRTA